MASLIDVAMAQHDTDVSKEELKMQKKIENSKTIRALDNFTAMSEGAQMGLSVYDMGSNIKSAAQGFKFRRDTRRGYIDKQVEGGMSRREARQSWRSTGKPEALKKLGDARSYASKMEIAGSELSENTLVSMYLEGTNVTSTAVNSSGETVVIDDKENGTPTNAGDYTDVQNMGTAKDAIPNNLQYGQPGYFGVNMVNKFLNWRSRRREEKNKGGGGGAG